jgi:FkbM family methyltransferase
METNTKFFVEIGAGCFNTLLYLATDKGWQGLVVEPVPEYFKMLDKVKGVSYENSAIGTEKKSVPFFYVTQATIKKYKLGDWMRGVGSVDRNHIENPEQNVTQITVPMITVADLLSKYSIKKIDYLKIDAEGLDCQILKQFDVSGITDIVFEWRNCTHADIDKVMEKLIKSGFSYKVEDDNVVAHKK